MKQAWEYKSFVVITAGRSVSYMEDGVAVSLPVSPTTVVQRIQSLGSEGWEMAGVASTEGGVGYWFKRPR